MNFPPVGTSEADRNCILAPGRIHIGRFLAHSGLGQNVLEGQGNFTCWLLRLQQIASWRCWRYSAFELPVHILSTVHFLLVVVRHVFKMLLIHTVLLYRYVYLVFVLYGLYTYLQYTIYLHYHICCIMLYIWYMCVYVCLCALFMHVQKSIGLSLFLLQLQCLGGVHELCGCPGHRGFLCWSYFLLGLQNWDGSKSHVLQLHNLVLHVLQQLTVRSESQQRLTVIHRDCDICDRPAEHAELSQHDVWKRPMSWGFVQTTFSDHLSSEAFPAATNRQAGKGDSHGGHEQCVTWCFIGIEMSSHWFFRAALQADGFA